ncbi:MAG: hypothetical protein GXP13_04040 [Gammaproteobacteria bacterium]|nr:hypothetical protein [Gammaproteobacteria bacterium]
MNQTAVTPLITPSVPSGDMDMVNEIFEGIMTHIGFVPDALKLYSISPPLLQTFVGNIGYFSQASNLSAELTTMIRYLVSSKAKCQFCIDMNEGFMTNLGVDVNTVRASRDNPSLAPLKDNEKVLLLLALKSVDTPDSIGHDDINLAKEAGWNDRDIFDAVVQAANNRALNYVLRTFNIHHQGSYS